MWVLRFALISNDALLITPCYRELTATDVDFAVVRPLVQKYARLQNMAVVYACMVARSYFLSQVTKEMALSPVLTSRATLCEILALRLLACSASSKLQLVAVLTTPWNPLAGAPLDVVEEVKLVIGTEDAAENSQSAIEVGAYILIVIPPKMRRYRWQYPRKPRLSSRPPSYRALSTICTLVESSLPSPETGLF